MATTKRSDGPSVALAEGYYYENGCTIASNVHLTERNYGTRRTFFFKCDPAAVQAILPDGWILRALKDIMGFAELVAMNHNPAYMREVFERD